MNLNTFIFLAMLTVMPKNQPHVNIAKESDRMWNLANAMATAIEKNPDFKLFNGPAHNLATATILVTTAWGESGFREDVQRCQKKGDGGRSITSFQMMKPWALSRRIKITKEINLGNKKISQSYWIWKKIFTEKQLCSDVNLAADQSLYMFSQIRQVCPRGAPANFFAAYGTGRCSKRVKATDNRCYIWSKLSKNMGLINTHCETRRKNIYIDENKLNKVLNKNKKNLLRVGAKF